MLYRLTNTIRQPLREFEAETDGAAIVAAQHFVDAQEATTGAVFRLEIRNGEWRLVRFLVNEKRRRRTCAKCRESYVGLEHFCK